MFASEHDLALAVVPDLRRRYGHGAGLPAVHNGHRTLRLKQAARRFLPAI
jgi:hypothetical protein